MSPLDKAIAERFHQELHKRASAAISAHLEARAALLAEIDALNVDAARRERIAKALKTYEATCSDKFAAVAVVTGEIASQTLRIAAEDSDVVSA